LDSCTKIDEGEKVAEFEDSRAPERCLNCKSTNIIGPYKFVDSVIRIAAFILVRQQAFVCVDCGYTMLFTREGHEEKILKESLRIQSGHQ
jgi:transposase-like protein